MSPLTLGVIQLRAVLLCRGQRGVWIRQMVALPFHVSARPGAHDFTAFGGMSDIAPITRVLFHCQPIVVQSEGFSSDVQDTLWPRGVGIRQKVALPFHISAIPGGQWLPESDFLQIRYPVGCD